MYSVLVKAEATETRTLLNLHDLTTAFQDERLRPGAAAGPIQASYNLIVQDWTTDSGEPGDNYHPELAALLQEASVGIELDAQLMQELLDRIEALDPALGRLLINDPDGVDTMLIQFPAFAGDTALAKNTQRELDELWLGDSDALTATSSSIISFTVTDAITEQQTEAISTTIAVALTVLALFFLGDGAPACAWLYARIRRFLLVRYGSRLGQRWRLLGIPLLPHNIDRSPRSRMGSESTTPSSYDPPLSGRE